MTSTPAREDLGTARDSFSPRAVNSTANLFGKAGVSTSPVISPSTNRKRSLSSTQELEGDSAATQPNRKRLFDTSLPLPSGSGAVQDDPFTSTLTLTFAEAMVALQQYTTAAQGRPWYLTLRKYPELSDDPTYQALCVRLETIFDSWVAKCAEHAQQLHPTIRSRPVDRLQTMVDIVLTELDRRWEEAQGARGHSSLTRLRTFVSSVESLLAQDQLAVKLLNASLIVAPNAPFDRCVSVLPTMVQHNFQQARKLISTSPEKANALLSISQAITLSNLFHSSKQLIIESRHDISTLQGQSKDWIEAYNRIQKNPNRVLYQFLLKHNAADGLNGTAAGAKAKKADLMRRLEQAIEAGNIRDSTNTSYHMNLRLVEEVAAYKKGNAPHTSGKKDVKGKGKADAQAPSLSSDDESMA